MLKFFILENVAQSKHIKMDLFQQKAVPALCAVRRVYPETSPTKPSHSALYNPTVPSTFASNLSRA